MQSIKKVLIRLLSFVFNKYFDFYTGGKKRAVFFNIDETCKDLRLLEQQFHSIRGEVEQLLHINKLKKYHEIDALQYNISAVKDPDKSWKVFMLYLMGDFAPEALASCPTTCSLLKQIPQIYQCFFSILDPCKNIPAHNGAYRGYLRYHLGLKVPSVKPPYIRIKDEYYTWSEKHSVLFDDSWNHEVINTCNEERVVLVVDIYRPLPNIPSKVNHFVTRHLIKRFYAEKLLKKL